MSQRFFEEKQPPKRVITNFNVKDFERAFVKVQRGW